MGSLRSNLDVSTTNYLMDHVDSGAELIGRVMSGLVAGTTTNLLVLDSALSDFPVLELGFAVRALETAFEEGRIPMIFLGLGGGKLKAGCRQVGDAKLLETKADQAPDELAQKLAALVETAAARA